MSSIMRLILIPCTPFVGHPERSFIMAIGFVVFLALSRWRSRRPRPLTQVTLLVTALLWMAFGYWEFQAMQNEWNIRVDLLFAWPVLAAVSAVSAWLGIRSLLGHHKLKDDLQHAGN